MNKTIEHGYVTAEREAFAAAPESVGDVMGRTSLRLQACINYIVQAELDAAGKDGYNVEDFCNGIAHGISGIYAVTHMNLEVNFGREKSLQTILSMINLSTELMAQAVTGKAVAYELPKATPRGGRG